MINLSKLDDVKALQSNLRAAFETAQGKEAMKFIEQIGSWYPKVTDSMETNDIISRDANRRLIGTIKTLLELSADQIVELSNRQGGE